MNSFCFDKCTRRLFCFNKYMYVSDKKEKISRLVEFIISITKKMKDTCLHCVK